MSGVRCICTMNFLVANVFIGKGFIFSVVLLLEELASLRGNRLNKLNLKYLLVVFAKISRNWYISD